MRRAKRSQFLQADWFSRCGGTCGTTREIDELNVVYNTKAGDSYCSLSPACPFSYIQASTGLSEELLKRWRRTEVFVFLQLAAVVPIAFNYRRWLPILLAMNLDEQRSPVPVNARASRRL